MVPARVQRGALVVRPGAAQQPQRVGHGEVAVVPRADDQQRRAEPRDRSEPVQAGAGEVRLAGEAHDAGEAQSRRVRQRGGAAERRTHQEHLFRAVGLETGDGRAEVAAVGEEVARRRGTIRIAEAAEVEREHAHPGMLERRHVRQPAAEVGRRLVREHDADVPAPRLDRVETDSVFGTEPERFGRNTERRAALRGERQQLTRPVTGTGRDERARGDRGAK